MQYVRIYTCTYIHTKILMYAYCIFPVYLLAHTHTHTHIDSLEKTYCYYLIFELPHLKVQFPLPSGGACTPC